MFVLESSQIRIRKIVCCPRLSSWKTQRKLDLKMFEIGLRFFEFAFHSKKNNEIKVFTDNFKMFAINSYRFDEYKTRFSQNVVWKCLIFGLQHIPARSTQFHTFLWYSFQWANLKKEVGKTALLVYNIVEAWFFDLGLTGKRWQFDVYSQHGISISL